MTLSGGANATTSGGATSQTGLTGAMTTVTYTANTGYYFAEFADITANGITAKRTSSTVATVSGTPTADAAITVPDAAAIPTYEVIYKVANGTWSDGSTADKKETVQSGVKPASVPTGMKAASGYTGGAWDTDPASAVITGAKTFTYTFTAIPTYEVTYKVVGGTWSDGSSTDKKETVQSGVKPASVPTGMKASEDYTGGAWDTDPASAAITGAKTFTYSFTAKQAATVTKAPEAKTLTYNGSAQELVTAGTATGGEMWYALGTATEATGPYTTSIPTATDIGTYYVWYKVAGDDNHNDAAPKSVTVTIAAEATTTATVTFKVASGSWDDGITAEQTVTLTGKEGDELNLSSDQIPAVGNKPATGYQEGSWDTAPGTTAAITADVTYTYTYAAKGDVTRKVIFKVTNGSWGDGTAADKSITLTGKEGDELRLAAEDIPAVGSKPAAGYQAGSWDVEPSAATAITMDTTYTYTYAAKSGDPTPAPKPSPSPKPTPSPAPTPAPVPYDARGRYRYDTSSGSSSSSSSASEAPVVQRAGMHRMFNPKTGEHFYTASDTERDDLKGKGWSYEGVAFYVPKKSKTPVWRLFNPKTGEHYYTTDKDERDKLLKEGWNDEGVAWYAADDAKGKAMYRLFDPKANPVASHHFTSSEKERQDLIAAGWADEGVGFYALG